MMDGGGKAPAGAARRAKPTLASERDPTSRILVVQNHNSGTPGHLGETLAALGAALDIVTPPDGDTLPSRSEAYAGMVVLGGPQDALNDSEYPYYPPLLDLMRKFHAEDRPILGVCLGGQLLARAFGAPLALGGPREIGFVPISAMPEASADPVFHDLGTGFPIFAWHTDSFAVPGEAVHLASGQDYPAQAFRIGRASYGVQFHFEVTRAIVDSWVEGCPWLIEQEPAFLERLPGDLDRHLRPSLDFCSRIARRWLAEVEAAAAPRRAKALGAS